MFRSTLFAFTALFASAAALQAQNYVTDGSFESVQFGDNNFTYQPTGLPWAFNSTSGVIDPASAFGAPTTGLNGNQVAFLQSNAGDSHDNGARGSIVQQINLPSAGTYQLSLVQAYRDAPARYQVLLDGIRVDPGVYALKNTTFLPTSFAFAATGGAHTLTLQSTGPTDSTTFIDNLRLSAYTSGFNFKAFTGDADSGISTSNTYTHAINFNGPDLTINGVTFAGGGNGLQAGLHYDLEGNGNAFTNNPNDNLTGVSNDLAKTFFFGGAPATLSLSGLTTGQTYLTTFYGVGFGGPGGRGATVTDPNSNSIFFDQNYTDNGNGNLLQDMFTATSDTMSFTFAPDNAGNTFHFYGFTNQVVPEPGTAGLVLFGTLALAARRRRASSSAS